MKIESVNFSPLVEKWEDPGDYPNALAQGPLPSYYYLESVEGDVKIKIDSTDGDLFYLKDSSFTDSEFEEHYEDLYQEVYQQVPSGILIHRWEVSRDGDTLSVEIVESEDDGYLESLDERYDR